MLKTLLSTLVSLIIAAAVLAGGGFFWVEKEVEKAGPLQEPKYVQIEFGTSLRDIAELLESESVIRNADLFYWHTRYTGIYKGVQAGEYEFLPGMSQLDVQQKMLTHDVVQRFVTIAEGLASKEVIDRLMAVPELDGEVSEIPKEGSLLPETYSFTRNDKREIIIFRMQAAMAAAETDLWPQRAPDLPFDSWQEAVILASIVEKETGVAAERGKVAGVFVNRLRKGMRLQSDPTVIYGITNGAGPLGRKLRRSDLDTDTPYNTYTRTGLPPGPICNPGRDALKAVLNPEQTEALFFVADGSGGHAFAKTLAEHNRNVAKWRKLQKQQNQN